MNQDLSKLNRKELLEILVIQSEKIDELEFTLKEKEKELKNRNIVYENSGSLADACIEINKLFETANKVKEQVTANAKKLEELEAKEVELGEKVKKIMMTIPNIIDPSVPIGKDDSENVEITLYGALALSIGMALQNIPEGMVIIAPLMVAGVSTMRTFSISLAIGLLEIIGVFIGFGLGVASAAFLPIMLGVAGGAMLYVILGELLPEAILMYKSKLPALLTFIGILVGFALVNL